MVPFIKLRGKHECLPVPVGWNCPVYRGHHSLITPRMVYVRKLKGTSEFDLKNRCLFCWKSEFVFKKLNWKIEVCFKKWEFVFENRSLKVEVCFRKSELKIRICFWKSEFDVGACSARVAWALVPDCAEGSMFRHWRNAGQCWSNDDKKTSFLNLTQNQVKDPQETLCKRRKKRKKTERGTTCPPLTKNTNHRITKEIRTENAATVKHFQKKK